MTLDESVGMALLIVLDTLTPAQRVTLVLHDIFGYPFATVAQIVGRTSAACRQLASAARQRVKNAQLPTTSTADQARIVSEFKQAWDAKDVSGLIDLLDPDATAIADGGGVVMAHVRPVRGNEHIARNVLDFASMAPGLTIAERTVNGQPGLVAQVDGRTVTVFAFEVADGRIKRIWAVRNPAKLVGWM